MCILLARSCVGCVRWICVQMLLIGAMCVSQSPAKRLVIMIACFDCFFLAACSAAQRRELRKHVVLSCAVTLHHAQCMF